MKKNLKYYLFIAALMMVASASAQIFAQEPVATMQSTSTMAGSGSSLPSAAVGGAYTSYGESSTPSRPSGPRRVVDPDDVDEKSDSNAEPFKDPIGATPWVMMVLLCGGYVVLRRRSAELGNRAE